MGIGFDAIEMIFRDHTYRPIDGDVLLIGRQTVYLSPDEILALMKSHNIETRLDPKFIQIDKETLNRKSGIKDGDLISDFSLFHMLGVRSVKALDHSNYEGAEIIHDLTKPLPAHLRGISDYIVDGSTLDNVFNPALALQNFAELLRPGGRIILGNMLSNHNEPYNMLPPLWYLDYFTVNNFVDCRVYIFLINNSGLNVFCINLDYLEDPNRFVSSFASPYEMFVMVFAEKGVQSTSDIFPSQQHYRSDLDWKRYRQSLSIIKNNKRPHLARSRWPIFFPDVKAGHLFMNDQFMPVDPTEELMRTKFQHA